MLPPHHGNVAVVEAVALVQQMQSKPDHNGVRKSLENSAKQTPDQSFTNALRLSQLEQSTC